MRVNYIELAGKKYPMCFSMSATEDICDAFGSTEAMFEAVGAADVKRRLQAFDTVLGILMRAGRKYCQLMGEEVPDELPCRPADVIDMSDPDAMTTLFSTISGDAETKVETVSKNAVPTQDD